MRSGLLGLLLCFAVAGCATHVEPCHGPLQPINAPPQSKAAQTPSSADPRAWIP
jgi:hypothetical protein